jgi:hypothetical protein
METVLDGVNHIAILTRDMDRFIRSTKRRLMQP